MGGPEATRKDFPVQLWRIWSDENGKYGEPVGYRINGVMFDGQELTTRIHTWKVELIDERECANPEAHSDDESVDFRNLPEDLPVNPEIGREQCAPHEMGDYRNYPEDLPVKARPRAQTDHELDGFRNSPVNSPDDPEKMGVSISRSSRNIPEGPVLENLERNGVLRC